MWISNTVNPNPPSVVYMNPPRGTTMMGIPKFLEIGCDYPKTRLLNTNHRSYLRSFFATINYGGVVSKGFLHFGADWSPQNRWVFGHVCYCTSPIIMVSWKIYNPK